jgi:hypothetical protein
MRALSIPIAVDSGEATVIDLPAPIAPPSPGTPLAYEVEQEEPPERVREAATALAGQWGEGRIVAAGRTADRWRLEVEITDAAGRGWPVALWLDDTGTVSSPPAATR